MNTLNPKSYVALIGIDWADKKHDLCLLDLKTGEEERSVVDHNPKALKAWVRGLRQRFPRGKIAVGVEIAKGPLIQALAKYAFLEIFPINPSSLAHYRKSFHPSGAKDDPLDAGLLLDYMLKHGDRLAKLSPASAILRKLDQMSADRRSFIDDRNRITNRLRTALKQYYPHPLEWFESLDTPLFCAFIERWPTLKKVRMARRTTLERFFHKHNVRRATLIDKRLDAIRSAEPLTTDEAIIEPNVLFVKGLVAQLRTTLEAIDALDQALAQLTPTHKDYEIFASLPGAGPALTPRLLAAFGEDRARFPSFSDVACYTAIAPVIQRSGNKSVTKWRYRCNRFLRQTFVEWAGQTVRYSVWARAYYQLQRARGKSRNATLRALAFKWQRIVYRCWKEHKPYDEGRYLKALRDRRSPLLSYLTAAEPEEAIEPHGAAA